MNPRIKKASEDIERTKAKISELQALLPELERKKTDLENTEIVRLVRSANVAPAELAAFIESVKASKQVSRANDKQSPPGGNTVAAPPPKPKQEED